MDSFPGGVRGLNYAWDASLLGFGSLFVEQLELFACFFWAERVVHWLPLPRGKPGAELS